MPKPIAKWWITETKNQTHFTRASLHNTPFETKQFRLFSNCKLHKARQNTERPWHNHYQSLEAIYYRLYLKIITLFLQTLARSYLLSPVIWLSITNKRSTTLRGHWKGLRWLECVQASLHCSGTITDFICILLTTKFSYVTAARDGCLEY